MSPVTHPLVLVEVIPIISRDGTNISEPLAKAQLLNMSLRGMFHPGWLKYHESNKRLHKTVKGDKRKNKGAVEQVSSESSWAMTLRTFHETHESGAVHNKRRKAIVSGIIHFKNECYGSMSDYSSSNSIPLTYLLADDPLCESGVPCLLRGYIFENVQTMEPTHSVTSIHHETKCAVFSGTSVHVLPPIDAQNIIDHNVSARIDLGTSLLGYFNSQVNIMQNESGIRIQQTSDPPTTYSCLSCYDEETVRALTLRMSCMLLNTTWVGTTPRALSFWKGYITKTMNGELQLASFYDVQRRYCINNGNSYNNLVTARPLIDVRQCASDADSVPYLLREGALLLYNTHPNSGKTTLVTTIAKEILHCNSVHVISAPAIFAKYGTSADAALEVILHELALRGAVKSVSSEPRDEGSGNSIEKYSIGRVCIVLDHFESFVNHGSYIDSYTPVFNSMESYLNRLSFLLKSKHEFPFPSSSSLYKLDWSSPGFALPLGLCLIGVMTCNHDRSKTQISSQLSKAFDTIGGGRIYLPLPSASTRLSAFYHAFKALDIELDDEANQFLPELTASKSWAYGRSFLDVARRLRSLVGISCRRMATKADLMKAMDVMEGNLMKSSASATSSNSSLSTASSSYADLGFRSVGGNKEAKLALEDALALNPEKRRLLSRFGLQAPTGVLLYGPPGTGKTLLARAVARAMSTTDSSRNRHVVGKFISLKASDIVRPEVGNSEKLIVSAFEAARVNAPSVIFIDEFQVSVRPLFLLFLGGSLVYYLASCRRLCLVIAMKVA
ncbi:hypothetical protein ACHAWX_006130 [Stephanocyclus meneghinianus]